MHRCPGKKFLSFALLFFSSILGVKSISAQDTGAPAITTQPTNQTVTVGQSATFTAVVSSGPCRSLWFINGQGYYGPFSSTISYTITNTTLAMNGWTVAVSLYDCGSMGANLGNSQTAILTVTSGAQQQKSPAAPTIATQPANQTVAVGQPATFSVAANGTAPLSYQWQKNGSNIIGGGVEKRRSDVSLPVAIGEVFTAPPQSGLAWFCFLFPLIAPDVRISRIRRSEKAHGVAHGRLAVRSVRLTRPYTL